MSRLTGLLAASVLLATAAHAEEGSVPDWVKTDASSKSVTVELTAAYDEDSGSWTFNDLANGEATLVVPEGWQVTVTMINEDADNPHSVMVIERPEDEGEIPMSADEVEAAIEGGAPAAPVEGIPEGEEETIAFTAEPAGDYALYCGVPGHGMAGMWIGLEIDEEADEPHLVTAE
jgi:sulfocyanin